ncbi:MAG: translation initiation factor IF-3 [Opitutales bacterium]
MTPNNNQNKKFYNGKKKNFGPRRNERIRGPRSIRVIGPTGNQIGVMSPMEALQMAKGCGLDLVEISPTAQPPVCRIIDYGKYMYEESKKSKAGKSTAPKLKEVKFRPMTETHDYMTKLRNAEKFLFAGNKLKVSVFMRGREMEYKDLAFELCKRAIADLVQVGVADFPPRLAGRSVSFSMSPLPQPKRKLKYSGIDDDFEAEDDADNEDEEN